MDDIDIAIIGGGIVGCSTAMALARKFPGRRFALIEKEAEPAQHQSGHNSGVIHSGLYYKPGTLKARYGVDGARAMVRFCCEHGIPHKVCGKVVAATREDELPLLEKLHWCGTANGLEGLEIIGPERLKEIEPHAAGIKALHVPSTGVVRFPDVARKYAELFRAGGGETIFGRRVIAARREAGAWVMETSGGPLRARCFINCAGLYSDRIARASGMRVSRRIVPFRGEYFTLSARGGSLVKALIYPVPDPAFPFLGVHLTRMADGEVEAGPNAVLALSREGYRRGNFNLRDIWDTFTYGGFWRLARRHWCMAISEEHRSLCKKTFLKSLQRLLPELRIEDLHGRGSGVRAQLMEPDGRLTDDFVIEKAEGAIHVLNAPSPAATASIEIGERVAKEAEWHFGMK
jgi:(S)-2-hydroxyglutarate dehydrogenase